MYVTYRPEGGEERRWVFEPGKVRASRAEMIEKRAGENWDSWLASVQMGSMKARRVLLWHLLSLDHPTLRFEDVDFLADELVVEHSAAELAEIRARVYAAKLPDDQREQVLAVLDAEIEAAREREGRDGGEGKASSKRSGSATP